MRTNHNASGKPSLEGCVGLKYLLRWVLQATYPWVCGILTLDETAPVNKAAKKNKKKHDSKTEQQKVINSREEALSKLVQKQNYEIEELKGKIADLTTQNAKLTLSLQEQKPDAELNAKYVALQEKYLKNTERFAEKIYQMANIISGFAEHKPSEISGSNLNDVFVG